MTPTASVATRSVQSDPRSVLSDLLTLAVRFDEQLEDHYGYYTPIVSPARPEV